MLLRSIKLLVVLGLLLASVSTVWAQVDGWKMVHGEVVQVFADQHKIMLESSGQQRIYLLDADCQILRLGVPVSLESMRPIASNAYQDALCWINPQGLIGHVMVNYTVREQEGILVSYDIFGNLK